MADTTQSTHQTTTIPSTDPHLPSSNSQEPQTTIPASEHRDSLASTPNPTLASSALDNNNSDNTQSKTGLTSSVGQQNAPGRAGDIGEKAMGAFGYGGSTVERPKEEQGLGEKIVNFLGA